MSHQKQKNTRKMILVLLIFVLIVAAAMIIGHRIDKKEQTALEQKYQGDYIQAANQMDESDTSLTDDEVSFNGHQYVPKKNTEAILVMGVDEADIQKDSNFYTNDNQADFLMLMVLDHDAHTYQALQINRDTMTDIPTIGLNGEFIDYEQGQIALAHAYGSGLKDSCENEVTAVSRFLYGMTIDHYVSLSMPAIAEINDAVGGVTVTITDDFTEVDPALKEGETITLHGQQAETFVRTRKNVADQTNINRMARQRTYMSALKTKALECMQSDDTFALNLVLTLSDYMVSDMTAQKLADFATYMQDYTDEGVLQIQGESVKGERFMEFYADDTDLQKQVFTLYYQQVD